MEFTAQQIADLLGGTVEGDATTKVNNLSKIEEGKPGTLSFLANPKYAEYIYQTKASIIIINEDFAPEERLEPTLIRVKDAYKAFATLLNAYDTVRKNKTGREEPSYVSSSSELGENCYVAAFAYVSDHAVIGNNVKIYPHAFIGENVKVGDNSIINSGVKIYADCIIGSNCVIHAGSIIGADGFGFAPNSENNYEKVPQIGNVVIEDHVEIGANTTIDRATLGSTIIRKGVKLDNLIQVAHNVEVGENTVIAAQTGVAGSTKIGKNCMIGGQVGIVGHLHIADEVKIAAQSGIGNSVSQKGEILQGSPAFGIGDYKRSYVVYRKLPEMQDRISKLEKSIDTNPAK